MQINSRHPNYLKEFRDCFSDIGCLSEKHHIVIDTNHPPDVNLPTQIPYALRGKWKAELDKMIEMKIIQAVNEPTDWVNNLVLVQKPNGHGQYVLTLKNLIKLWNDPTMPIQLHKIYFV